MADISIPEALTSQAPVTEVNGYRIVKIQNCDSLLWAFAQPIPENQTSNQVFPIRVEPYSLQYDANETWKLILINREKHYYHIQNVATQKYAWDPEPPSKGEDVLQSDDRRLWQILWHAGDGRADGGHYTISPAGRAETELFWTDLVPEPGAPIKLEYYTRQKSDWRFYDVKKVEELGQLVKIQHAVSKLWALAPPVPPGVQPEEIPIVVAPDNFDNDKNEIWKLIRVEPNFSFPGGSDLQAKIAEGDLITRIRGCYYLIFNVGTGKYAWDPEQVKAGQDVVQSDNPRVWKIIHQKDHHYTISPAGEAENSLFWTDKNLNSPVGKKLSEMRPITLEHRAGELNHWKFTYVRSDIHRRD